MLSVIFPQTTLEDYKFSDYEVHRSEGDFEWLQSALEESCPERIIPPMVVHSSLHGTVSLCFSQDKDFKLQVMIGTFNQTCNNNNITNCKWFDVDDDDGDD